MIFQFFSLLSILYSVRSDTTFFNSLKVNIFPVDLHIGHSPSPFSTYDGFNSRKNSLTQRIGFSNCHIFKLSFMLHRAHTRCPFLQYVPELILNFRFLPHLSQTIFLPNIIMPNSPKVHGFVTAHPSPSHDRALPGSVTFAARLAPTWFFTRPGEKAKNARWRLPLLPG